ncbi:MAG TPA: hypothetical protein VLF43_05400 [Candidatus Saccharimonadales bacterium]|nr:hypothetical protein [Candidatus Saccharimonadales bacterium]
MARHNSRDPRTGTAGLGSIVQRLRADNSDVLDGNLLDDSKAPQRYNIVRAATSPHTQALLQGVGSAALKYARATTADVRLWTPGEIYAPLFSNGAISTLTAAARGRGEPAIYIFQRILETAKANAPDAISGTVRANPKVYMNDKPPSVGLPITSPAAERDAKMLTETARAEIGKGVAYNADTSQVIRLGITNKPWRPDVQRNLQALRMPDWAPGTVIGLGELQLVDMNAVLSYPPLQ